MRSRNTSFLSVFLCFVLTGCPQPVEKPVDHDGLGTDLGNACVTLRTLHCPEGDAANGSTCFEHLTRRSALVVVPTACLRDAASPDDVRACGGADTLRIRCLR